MPHTNLKPLPLAELARYTVGDKFIVRYAKDDDSNDVRCDFETQTIKTVYADEDTLIFNTGIFDWTLHRSRDCLDESNCLVTSRGNAYFYREEDPSEKAFRLIEGYYAGRVPPEPTSLEPVDEEKRKWMREADFDKEDD